MDLGLWCADEGWSRVPQLKTRRCNPHTIVLGGKIYVLGGFEFKKNKNNCFHWMEVLDSIKKWEAFTNPNFNIRLNSFNGMLMLGFFSVPIFFNGVKNLHRVKIIVLILFELKSSQNI